MIKLNLKNTFIEDEEFSKYEQTVRKISEGMDNYSTVGSDFLGWKDLPTKFDKELVKQIEEIVDDLVKKGVNTLVVVGIGGSFAGAKAGIDMILGELSINHKMEIVYLGESVSSTNMYQKLAYLSKRKFAINVISKSGTTTEPAIAFKFAKRLLEEREGKFKAKEFIIATTDANKGVLKNMATKNGYRTFVIPDDIGGRFSVLTPVGLFPLACAGVNIEKVLQGAKSAHKEYSSHSLMENDAYKYAVSRYLLYKKYPVELMIQFEPQMKAFSEWWKQLAGESEGKNGKGLFPASAIFSTDLHSLGQYIQDGRKILFETSLFVTNPKHDIEIFSEEENLDQLNYITGKTIQEINKVIYTSTIDAHNKVAKVPMINLEIAKMDETHFGELVYFFEKAIAMTAYLLDVNPFDQPGVEVYKLNMFKLLGK